MQNDFLERYDKSCKVTNVKMDHNQFLQAVLPAAKGGMGVSSARLLGFVPVGHIWKFDLEKSKST